MLYNKNILKCSYVYIFKRSAVDLAYKIHGQIAADSPPIIVLHGLLGSKKNWESMCKMINSATNNAVVAVDARNHGESPHSNSHSYQDLASDIGPLLKKLSISKSVVLGHSMGGRIGMVFALTEPEKVSALIVVDVSPVSTPGILNNFFPQLLDVMKTIKFDGIDNLSKARALAKDKLTASGIIDHPGTMGFIIMNVGVKPNKSIGWMCNIDVLKNQFGEIATFPKEMIGKQYKGRTLFIGGEESNYIPNFIINSSIFSLPSNNTAHGMYPFFRFKRKDEALHVIVHNPTDNEWNNLPHQCFCPIVSSKLGSGDITGIKQYFPQADLKVVTGVGHNVHAEDPKTFLNIVTTFLK